MREGFGFRPSGLSKVIVIARPISEDRLKFSELILEKENRFLIVKSKTLRRSFKIDRSRVIPGLRSLTGIKRIDITGLTDYFIISPYDEAKHIGRIFIKKIDWEKVKIYSDRLGVCNLVLPDKLNLSSPNTFIVSAYSDKAFLPSNMFYLYYTKNKEDAKIFSLYFNSIVSIAQFVLNRPETLGAYFRMRIEDWKKVYVMNVENLKNEEKAYLIEVFEKLKNIEFPSIIEQLENRFWARVELDKSILKILGFSDKEIDYWLPKVYDAIVKELKAMREVR